MTLQKKFNANEGYNASNITENLIGKKGKALTPLRPAGKVIIENKVFDAIAQTGWIEIAEEIIVIEQAMRITVKKT